MLKPSLWPNLWRESVPSDAKLKKIQLDFKKNKHISNIFSTCTHRKKQSSIITDGGETLSAKHSGRGKGPFLKLHLESISVDFK